MIIAGRKQYNISLSIDKIFCSKFIKSFQGHCELQGKSLSIIL